MGALLASASDDWKWIHFEDRSVEEWSDKFLLTHEHRDQIDPELRWLVSFPLVMSIQDEDHTAGVLNVDGLTESLTPSEMLSIYQTLKPEINRLTQALSKQDKCRITIAVEDIVTDSAT